MDIRKSKVEASYREAEDGIRLGPGLMVDLDQKFASGKTVREVFPAEWFDAIEDKPVTEHGLLPAEREEQ